MGADEVIRLYRWLSIPRIATIVVSIGSLGIFWMLHASAFDSRPALFAVIPAYVAASLAVWLLMRHKVKPLALLCGQLLIDLAGVTAGVLYTGGIRSPFILLFILVIISASIVSMRMLVAIVVMTAIIFEAISVAEHAGLFPALANSPLAYQQQDAITIVNFGLIIALIIFHSSYYVSRIREKEKDATQLKDEFLFRTVHDLRSPSTMIRFVVEKYKDQASAAANPEFKKDLDLVGAALGRMSRLIEDLMRMGAGERPEFEIGADALDLSAIVRSAASELGPAMVNKNVTFSYVPPAFAPMVTGDADKLKEVFSNLIDNAIKFNREGGTITVTQRREGKTLSTEIKDTGSGISPHALEKLFTAYFRGDIGMGVQGTGLGLFVTRKLVEKMHGKVEVRSKEGKGSTFTVFLPVAGA